MAGCETRGSVKWSVGIVTCPRKDGYFLDKTAESIKNAGWDHATIFAEPHSIIPDDFQGDVVTRRKQFGDWTNWAVGLYELLLSEPDADYFLMSEDDVIYNRDSRKYLEFSFPHLGRFGSLSLYTPSKYHRKNYCGWHDECHGVETWSTVTVIMPKESVIQFFADEGTQRHRHEDVLNYSGQWGVSVDPRNSVKDAVIGVWAAKNLLPIYYHTPALAQHIGISSSISDEKASVVNSRMALDFVGEDAPLQMLGRPKVKRNQVKCL